MAKFSGVHCIDLHFPRNFGAESTKIHFIGFKGEHTQVNLHSVALWLSEYGLGVQTCPMWNHLSTLIMLRVSGNQMCYTVRTGVVFHLRI